MTLEERITELELRFKKELAEIKAALVVPNPNGYKKGDFIRMDWNGCYRIAIFKEFRQAPDCLKCVCFVSVDTNPQLCLNYLDEFDMRHSNRLATESEKQLLLDKLHEAGKDWDAEKCEIVDYRWAPKRGERYFTPRSILVDLYSECVNVNSTLDRRIIERNLAFKTPEEAIKVAQGWLDSLK